MGPWQSALWVVINATGADMSSWKCMFWCNVSPLMRNTGGLCGSVIYNPLNPGKLHTFDIAMQIISPRTTKPRVFVWLMRALMNRGVKVRLSARERLWGGEGGSSLSCGCSRYKSGWLLKSPPCLPSFVKPISKNGSKNQEGMWILCFPKKLWIVSDRSALCDVFESSLFVTV